MSLTRIKTARPRIQDWYTIAVVRSRGMPTEGAFRPRCADGCMVVTTTNRITSLARLKNRLAGRLKYSAHFHACAHTLVLAILTDTLSLYPRLDTASH